MPEEPGVYQFLNEKGVVIYVGKAKNLKKRVTSYFTHKDLGYKTSLLISQIKKIRFIVVNSELESLLLEANLIKEFLPKFNIKLMDGKAYPLIRITIKDKYPKVLTARKEDDKRSLYFGPYPNAGSMKLVLKTVRRIFPFETALNHPKKPCLYYHLSLCPCCEYYGDGKYKKEIRRIINFLKGKTKDVIKDLEKERNTLSKSENFEQANLIQKKIDAIKYVTSPIYKPFEYELNPNLKTDIRQKETTLLLEVLNRHGIDVKKLERIECFDISNISGSLVTGSMVVFENGDPNKNEYKRFKIKNETMGKPNDFAAIAEIISRRLKHTDWTLPDLIIVDGGKGQVSFANKAMNELGINIPIIGLAKREETIITSNLKEINLPRNNQALYLIMRVRDEAHRFAINYHKKLRSKNIFS